MTDTPAPTDGYAGAAKNNFDALTKQYGSNDKKPKENRVSFWKLGNSFDTMIDYLEVLDSSTAQDVAQMAVTQLNASLKDIDGGYDGAWFDDFGWWSVATQRALQKPFFNSDSKQQLKKILDACWSRFTANAPLVWERRTSAKFDSYGPAHVGGVWNAYWDGTDKQYLGPKNGDPSNGKLIGIQNTVTNALYLMAAHRLGATDPDARKAAESEWQFLLAWLDETQDPLWWTFDDTTGLVRERVGHFAKGLKAPFHEDWRCTGFHEKWAWSGDQGLMLGNFSDAILATDPGHRENLIARAQHLLSGVRQHLVDANHVVQNYSTTGCIPDGDANDYRVGSGVFWRNYLYVWNTNPDLRSFLTGADYAAMVKASADAAAKPLTGNESFETLGNQTAVLVAACAK